MSSKYAVFGGDDAKRVRQQQGLEASHAGKMISTRKTRKHVIQISDFSFKKATKEINYVTKRN